MSGNPLGGKNPHGLYIPLSDVEREAAHRAAERGIVVDVQGWGRFSADGFHVGEHRVGVDFALRCPDDRPEGLEATDLRVQVSTTDGIPIFATTQSLVFDGKPVVLRPGNEAGLTLEIEVHHCDPALVKELTGAIGLTSRRVDPQTGRWDGAGNMRLDEPGLRALHQLDVSYQVRAARQRQK